MSSHVIRRVLDTLFVMVLIGGVALWWRGRASNETALSELVEVPSADSLAMMIESLGEHSGPEDPAARIVTFFDFSCGWCSESDSTLRALQSRYPDHLAITRVDFVLDTLGHVASAHEAAHCAQDVGRYDAIVASAFRHQADVSNRNGWTMPLQGEAETVIRSIRRCVAGLTHRARTSASTRLARTLGLSVTPSYLIDGRVYSGLIDPPTLDSIVVALIRSATGRAPAVSQD